MMLWPGDFPVHTGKPAFVDLPVHFLNEMVAASAGREVAFHFKVPNVLSLLFEPVGELPAIGFWQLLNRSFDGVDCHVLSVTYLLRRLAIASAS